MIQNADEITVTLLDDRQVKAEIVGRDKASDVAVLKEEIPIWRLTEMPLADSSKADSGRLRARNRQSLRAQPHGHLRHHQRARALPDNNPRVVSEKDFIQTDAPIGNPRQFRRCAGGSRAGVSWSRSIPPFSPAAGGNIGIGFAIPSNMVKAVMAKRGQYGEVKRGMLGVQLSNNFTPGIAQ